MKCPCCRTRPPPFIRSMRKPTLPGPPGASTVRVILLTRSYENREIHAIQRMIFNSFARNTAWVRRLTPSFE